jgi:hypothetical protein
MRIIFKFLLACFFFTGTAFSIQAEFSSEEISWIGEKIFANECSSRDDLLLQWNDGEDFLSLGIGHFIWYPEGEKGFFEESFPDFLKFAKSSGADIPTWLSVDIGQHCPWRTKEDFLKNQKHEKIVKLRAFLKGAKPLQAEFIIERFNSLLPMMIETISDIKQRQKAAKHIERLFSTARGTYALVDYANFKGMGVSPAERYKGRGWGLLQVLLDMRDKDTAPDAVREFSESAERVLVRRVENSPKERNEQQWLAGWRNRVKTYLRDGS